MATARFTSYGALIEFDNTEINLIASLISSGSQVGTIASALAAMFTGPVALVATVISALFGLGANLLTACNAQGKEISIKIFWYGRMWCYSKP
jgi:hypothetical protein